ncbi:MAG TPA: bacillithiol biosynthesis cysteine-adding enzyme BshC [Saprospiraceae bacterium]|nr:bacillithiol biosynthesis cysteine-adding enzyme BshC [Saprospiraceae bacterium]
MEIIHCDYNSIPNLAKFDLGYINKDPKLDKYISFPPNEEGIEQSINAHKSQFTHRAKLQIILKKQHQNYSNTILTTSIESLAKDTTFCITTAHQPCLFGGPLYFVYKIASAINLSNTLNKKYPQYHFVPVYYMGDEDHDFDEIKHLNLFGKTINWDRNEGGPVGRYSLEGLDEVIKSILSNFDNDPVKKQRLELLLSGKINAKNYGELIKQFVYTVFDGYPVVVVDPDDKAFKELMIPIFEEELRNKRSFELIQPALKSLEADNYKVQAPGRELNVFYMLDGMRERIIMEGNVYQVVNTNYTFSLDEIIKELNNYPERFSPNVILRPLYQETILPSVVFIGGGGEVAYWLELKEVFQYFKVPHPVIMRRNSAAWIDKSLNKRIQKTGLSILDYTISLKDIQEKYLVSNDSKVELEKEKEELKKVFKSIDKLVQKIDASLSGKLAVDENNVLAKLTEWEGRLNKTLKTKHDVVLQQIAAVYEKLYPNNGLQERVESFLPYYAEYGNEYIKALVDNLNPLDLSFLIMMPD